MRPVLLRVVAIEPLLVLGGCYFAARGGRNDWLRDELFFGRSIAPGRGCAADSVSETDWRGFVDSVVTPKVPKGLTVLDASGQYEENGAISRERTKLLIVVHPASDDTDRAIDAVIAEYLRRFCQTSVGHVTSRAHAHF